MSCQLLKRLGQLKTLRKLRLLHHSSRNITNTHFMNAHDVCSLGSMESESGAVRWSCGCFCAAKVRKWRVIPAESVHKRSLDLKKHFLQSNKWIINRNIFKHVITKPALFLSNSISYQFNWVISRTERKLTLLLTSVYFKTQLQTRMRDESETNVTASHPLQIAFLTFTWIP